MSKTPSVTQKMIQNALDDRDITLFAQEEPIHFGIAEIAFKERWYFLFTKPIEIPGQVKPIHLGVHLIGADGGFINHHLFHGWNIVISDESENIAFTRSNFNRTFEFGYAIRDKVALRSKMGFDSDNATEFWDYAFSRPENHQAFLQMVSSHPPAPHDRVPSQLSYAGRGVGFSHIVPDMKRAWRVWHEWLVSASILRIW